MLSDYKEFLSVSASVTTVLQFFSGCLVCKKYISSGTTGDDSSFPFTLGFFSCSLWLCYGLVVVNPVITFVNITGCTLFLCYVFIFYYYTLHKTRVRNQLLLVLFLICVMNLYMKIELNEELLKYRIGCIACVTTVCFCASPLLNLVHVIKVKSAESLPKPLIIMGTLVSLQWFLYGIILNDSFLQFPNLLSFIFSVFQLVLCIIYSGKKSSLPYTKLTSTL